MTRSKKIVTGLTAAACSLLLICSNEDVITGVGGDVVKDMDKTLTDMAGGFIRINLDALDDFEAFEAYSLPLTPDSAFSTQSANFIYIGISGHGDTLAAQMQYRVTRFPSGTPSYIKDDTMGDAYLYFMREPANAGDTLLSASDTVRIFPSDTLTGLSPVSRADKNLFIIIPPDDGDGGNGDDDGDGDNGGDNGANGGPATTDNRIGAFLFGDKKSVDSLKLPDSVAEKIFKVRTGSVDDNDSVYTFAFSIVDYHGAIIKIRNPYIIVNVTRITGATARDSITALTRFTAYENADMAQTRAAAPFSSQLTQRTAVFKVNVDKIIDSLNKLSGVSRYELINAVIAVNSINTAADADAVTASGDADTSIAGSYRIIALDTLFTNEQAIGESNANSILRGLFLSANSNRQRLPYSVHSIKPPLRGAIGKPKPAYIYVYLRANADQGTIMWERPRHIETVFTPSRLRSQ